MNSNNSNILKKVIFVILALILLSSGFLLYAGHRDRKNKEIARAHEIIGVNLFEEGKYSEAEGALKQAIERDPRLWRGYYYLGSIYFEQRKWAEAKREFETAVELNPEIREAFTALGIIAFREGNYAKSFAYFKRALELDPDNKEVKGLLEAVEKVAKREAGGK